MMMDHHAVYALQLPGDVAMGGKLPRSRVWLSVMEPGSRPIAKTLVGNVFSYQRVCESVTH
jgi:hypothetical protein